MLNRFKHVLEYAMIVIMALCFVGSCILIGTSLANAQTPPVPEKLYVDFEWQGVTTLDDFKTPIPPGYTITYRLYDCNANDAQVGPDVVGTTARHQRTAGVKCYFLRSILNGPGQPPEGAWSEKTENVLVAPGPAGSIPVRVLKPAKPGNFLAFPPKPVAP